MKGVMRGSRSKGDTVAGGWSKVFDAPAQQHIRPPVEDFA